MLLGVSVHAELVGREWIKNGHELKVFVPVDTEKAIIGSDEPFVVRCYSMKRSPSVALEDLWLDQKPFLQSDYDVFVVQNLELMPIYELVKIWPQIRKKAKTVLIIHEGNKSCFKKAHLLLEFDAIVCFDERYKNEFSQVFDPSKIHIIPYPAHPIMLWDKVKARDKLGIGLEDKVIFSYGIWFVIFSYGEQPHLICLDLTPQVLHLNIWLPLTLKPLYLLRYLILITNQSSKRCMTSLQEKTLTALNPFT